MYLQIKMLNLYLQIKMLNLFLQINLMIIILNYIIGEKSKNKYLISLFTHTKVKTTNHWAKVLRGNPSGHAIGNFADMTRCTP